MSDNRGMDALLFSSTVPRQVRYAQIIPYIQALLHDETDWIAGLANTAAVLHQGLGVFWTGFYRVCKDVLVLGPFQGPVACVRIKKSQGVCGTAWAEQRAQLVPDVHAFEGHIACNPNSRSEIVLPIFSNSTVVLILDIDSNRLNDFDSEDQMALEDVVALLQKWLPHTQFGA